MEFTYFHHVNKLPQKVSINTVPTKAKERLVRKMSCDSPDPFHQGSAQVQTEDRYFLTHLRQLL